MLTSLLILAAVGSPATAIVVDGEVLVDDGLNREPLARFTRVEEGWTVITGANSHAALRLVNGAELRLGSQTNVTLKEMKARVPRSASSVHLGITSGRLWVGLVSLFGKDAGFQVQVNDVLASGVGRQAFVARGAKGEENGWAFWAMPESAEATSNKFVIDRGALTLTREKSQRILIGAGAFTSTDRDGFSPPVRLDTIAIKKLRLSTGGAGAVFAALVFRSLSWPASGPPVRGSRSAFRRVVEPHDLVPAAAPGDASDMLRGVATIDARVRVLDQE